MILRAGNDEAALPAPAPGTIADVPAAFSQGPRKTINLIRESRSFLRRLAQN